MIRRWRDPRAIVTVVALIVLGVPALWQIFRHAGFAVGDVALIELRTRDVLSSAPPLVGAYSRYGWSHPGPLEFYLFAVPYRLLGADYRALQLTAATFNVAVVALIVWVARRRGTTATITLIGVCCALIWGSAPNALADSWNVTIAVLPFMLTIVACWCALCGDRWTWVVAAVGFSFVFQSHIGFGIVLLPLVAATAVALCVASYRHRIIIDRTEIAIGVIAAFAVAIPALYDVVVDWPGNLGRLMSWSFHNGEETVGLADGLRLVGRSTSLTFPFHPQLENQFVLSVGPVDSGFLPGALMILLVVALWLTIRRRMRAETILCGCLILVWSSAVMAAANVTQPLAAWLVAWLQPLAWLTWGAVVIVAWRMIEPALDRRIGRLRTRRVVAVTLIGCLAVGSVAHTHGLASATDVDTSRRPIRTFTDAAESLDRSQPLHIDYIGDPFSAGTTFLAVANQLDRAGFTLCVDERYENQFGRRRVCDGRPDVRLLIRDEPTTLPPPDGATTLAISDPLTPAERSEADTLTADLSDMLVRNDLDSDVPLLYTPLVTAILDHSPPPEVLAARADIMRLHQLRQIPGTRFGLYAITPDIG